MAPTQASDNLLVWGAQGIEGNTIIQAQRMADMDIVQGHVALMPDAHVGKGSTVGSVFATNSAVIPAAVGVDIGCGMAAVKLNIDQNLLPSLDDFMPMVEDAIPGGVGRTRNSSWDNSVNVFKTIGWSPGTEADRGLQRKAIEQCGTLGGGNHFFEICVDESNQVWLVLHSGSRGVGNMLAQGHISAARAIMKQQDIELPDLDLAYLEQGTDEFQAYIDDMLWAQDYAMLNRQTMLKNVLQAFLYYLTSHGVEGAKSIQEINCHHNFTTLEVFNGQEMWITRKGAIKANEGWLGIIPGSMGTSTYIVKGLGNPDSYNSCSHGAGRKFSRTKAKEHINPDRFKSQMAGKVWNDDHVKKLIDEAPDAYKKIEDVMEAQSDLVETVHVLKQVFNYKGVN